MLADSPNDKALAEANLGGLVDGLIGKSSRTRNNTDPSSLMYEPWHDTNLALTRSDQTGAVSSSY